MGSRPATVAELRAPIFMTSAHATSPGTLPHPAWLAKLHSPSKFVRKFPRSFSGHHGMQETSVSATVFRHPTVQEKSMSINVKPIPDGYSSITAYLNIKGATRAIEFYKRAFDAEEIYRLEMPDGRIGHAELQIGNSRIMLADEMLEMPDIVVKSPATVGATTVGLNLYLADVDARFAQAVAAGAKIKRPVQNQFYGDRSGTIEDPFGHVWTLSTHVEDVPPDEIKRRMAAMPKS
jgi:PhnB protein